MNKSRYDAHARATRAVAVGLIALPAAMAVGHPARVPQLTISITDGHVAVRPGQTLRYQASLRNTGTGAATDLGVTTTLSAGLAVTRASGNGVTRAGQVTWTITVPPDTTRTFLVTARVTRPPAHVLRLAAVACVTLPGSKQPTVCAAHLDALPAAKAAPRARHARHRSGSGAMPYASAALLLFFGCLAVSFFSFRARLRRRLPSRGAVRPEAAVPEMSVPATPNATGNELSWRPTTARGRKKDNRACSVPDCHAAGHEIK